MAVYRPRPRFVIGIAPYQFGANLVEIDVGLM